MMHPTSIKTTKLCAFCKYWYDPTNQYIQPSNPACYVWKYETGARCLCLKKNMQMAAGFNCSQYVCKL